MKRVVMPPRRIVLHSVRITGFVLCSVCSCVVCVCYRLPRWSRQPWNIEQGFGFGHLLRYKYTTTFPCPLLQLYLYLLRHSHTLSLLISFPGFLFLFLLLRLHSFTLFIVITPRSRSGFLFCVNPIRFTARSRPKKKDQNITYDDDAVLDHPPPPTS